MPETTEPKQVGTQFKPGQSGNPKGRPKGARSKLGEAFLNELLADFGKGGTEAIVKVREERPQDYLKVIASILPKELSGLEGEPIVAEIRRTIVRP
jgi:hypothetical protein